MNLIALRSSPPTHDSLSWNPVRAVRRSGAFFAVVLGGVLAAATLAAAPAAAQDERFAGIWQRDYSRSDAPWPGRHDRPQPNAPDIEIEIGFDGEDVVLVQTSRRRGFPTPNHVNVTYVTNNKPHAARDLRSGRLQEVRAK